MTPAEYEMETLRIQQENRIGNVKYVLAKRGFDVDALLRNVPGGIVRIEKWYGLNDLRALPEKPRVVRKVATCEGCGALVAPYAHQCDYCRRVK